MNHRHTFSCLQRSNYCHQILDICHINENHQLFENCHTKSYNHLKKYCHQILDNCHTNENHQIPFFFTVRKNGNKFVKRQFQGRNNSVLN